MQMEKINVMGGIKALKVKGRLILPKPHYKFSYIRTAMYSVKWDTGRKFTIQTNDKETIVTRIS